MLPPPGRFQHLIPEDTDTPYDEAKNVCRKTQVKTKGHVRLFHEFMLMNGDTRKMTDLSMSELDETMSRFFLNVRKLDGTEYEPITLRSIFGSIDRYARDQNYMGGIKITGNPQFGRAQKALEIKQEALKAMGKGKHPRKSRTPTSADIDLFYEKKLLGPYSPKSILNTLWFNNTVHFGMRGSANDHKALCWGDVVLLEDEERGMYLQLNKIFKPKSKEPSGISYRTPSNEPPIKPKMYCKPGNPTRCPVELYKLYAEKRQNDDPTSPFYLRPNVISIDSDGSDPWFSDCPAGSMKLGNLLKTMCQEAGITDRQITNHGARAYKTQLMSESSM